MGWTMFDPAAELLKSKMSPIEHISAGDYGDAVYQLTVAFALVKRRGDSHEYSFLSRMDMRRRRRKLIDIELVGKAIQLLLINMKYLPTDLRLTSDERNSDTQRNTSSVVPKATPPTGVGGSANVTLLCPNNRFDIGRIHARNANRLLVFAGYDLSSVVESQSRPDPFAALPACLPQRRDADPYRNNGSKADHNLCDIGENFKRGRPWIGHRYGETRQLTVFGRLP